MLATFLLVDLALAIPGSSVWVPMETVRGAWHKPARRGKGLLTLAAGCRDGAACANIKWLGVWRLDGPLESPGRASVRSLSTNSSRSIVE